MLRRPRRKLFRRTNLVKSRRGGKCLVISLLLGKIFGQAGSNSDEMVNVMLLKGEAEESRGSCCQEDICCRCQQRRSQEKVSTITFN